MAPGNNERHPGHTGTIPKTKARNNCNVPQEAVTPTRRDMASNLVSTSLDWVPVSEYNTRSNYNQSRKQTNNTSDQELNDLGNPTYTPEILTKTTMVNFAVKEQGLTSQLLGIVVRKERPQLEIMKDTLVTTIANNKKTLDNNCPPPMVVVGEDITTCNNDQYGTAPHIQGPNLPSWDYWVLCSVIECPQGASTTVKQYCGYQYQHKN